MFYGCLKGYEVFSIFIFLEGFCILGWKLYCMYLKLAEYLVNRHWFNWFIDWLGIGPPAYVTVSVWNSLGQWTKARLISFGIWAKARLIKFGIYFWLVVLRSGKTAQYIFSKYLLWK